MLFWGSLVVFLWFSRVSSDILLESIIYIYIIFF